MAVSLLSGSSDKCFLVSWCTLTVALSLSVLCLSVLVQHTLFLDLKVWIIPFDYIFTISRPPPLFLISLIFFHKSRNKYVNDIKCTSHCFNKLFTYWIKIEPILPTPHGILFFLAIHFVYFHLRHYFSGTPHPDTKKYFFIPLAWYLIAFLKPRSLITSMQTNETNSL